MNRLSFLKRLALIPLAAPAAIKATLVVPAPTRVTCEWDHQYLSPSVSRAYTRDVYSDGSRGPWRHHSTTDWSPFSPFLLHIDDPMFLT